MNKKISIKGADSLIILEGIKKKKGIHHPYSDGTGEIVTEYEHQVTIGLGHLIKNKEEFEVYKDGISEQEAFELFREDLGRFEKIVNNRAKYRKLEFNQIEFDALVIQCFNTPKGNLNIIKAIKSKDDNLEQVWYDNYSTRRGKFVQGLRNRRIREWELFNNGVYPV